MAHHVAFLRAINVGGRRITNDALAAAVARAGFADVRTFLASGNVIYEAGGMTPDASRAAVELAIEAAFGFVSEAFVRVRADLEVILRAEPFEAAQLAAAATAPQVLFLRDPLPVDVADEVGALSTDDDVLRPIGREVHWLPMQGLGRTSLDTNALDRLVGVNTVRSRNTLSRVLSRLG